MNRVISLTAAVAALMSACNVSMARNSTAKVPFVGCNADGMAGKEAAQKDTGSAPYVQASAAPYLAYYAVTNTFGILAPRGWYCFDYYYSNEEYLLVSPDPKIGRDADDSVSGTIPGMPGPAVQLTYLNAGTSGRFDVAAVAARLFPSERKFVEGVIAEGIEPANDFPTDPYPGDVLTRISDTDVAYITPPNRDGMGTDSQLVKNSNAILGEAIFGARGIMLADVRLPAGLRNLSSVILGQVRAISARELGE